MPLLLFKGLQVFPKAKTDLRQSQRGGPPDVLQLLSGAELFQNYDSTQS